MSNYYDLADQVYLVSGHKRSCIYDLPKERLCSISSSAKELIQQLSSQERFSSSLSKKEKNILDELIRHGLLVPVDSKPKQKNIMSLAQDTPSRFAWVEVTKQCNQQCVFCYEKTSLDSTQNLDLEDFKHVVKNLEEANIKKIQFIGGEPLLLGDTLKNMIVYGRKFFSSIEIFTNGILIDEKWCDFFYKHKIKVALSLHSYIAKEHEAITKTPQSHQKVIDTINLLDQYKITKRVESVKTSQCKLGEKPKDFCCELKSDPVRLCGKANFSLYDYTLFQQRAITKSKMCQSIKKSLILRCLSSHNCFAKNIYVDSQLEVLPCVMERRFSYGNLKNKTLKQCLQENIKIQNLTKDHINVCKDCEYRYACFDCRPDAFDNDKLDKPWFCTYDPYTATWTDPKKMYHNLQKRS